MGGARSLAGFSLPFGTWFGVCVRLNIWLLLVVFLLAMDYLDARRPGMMVAHIAMLLTALMLHEFGHRIVARRMGGSHEEFVLWPAGGVIPPNAPPYPLATFLTHGAGIFTNLVLAIGAASGIWLLTHAIPWDAINPLRLLSGSSAAEAGSQLSLMLLSLFVSANIGIATLAILPYYWFDGAHLLQSILWPWTGLRQAINVTCIFGMALAVPMFILYLGSIWGMLFWGMLFYSAYTHRKQLAYEDLEYDLTAAYSVAPTRPRRNPRKAKLQRWLMDRRASRQASLQKQIDAILEKVARSGMHSLSNSEKNLLEQASRDLREQESPPPK